MALALGLLRGLLGGLLGGLLLLLVRTPRCPPLLNK